MTTPTSPTMEGIGISRQEGESSRAKDRLPLGCNITQVPQLDIMINERVAEYWKEGMELNDEAKLGSSSCIYRVLPRFKKNNPSLYEPNMVSIGPYYYNRLLNTGNLKMGDVYKRKCFGNVLVRASDTSMITGIYRSCLNRISAQEPRIRDCYSEKFEVSGFEFYDMMVVDAMFILEIIDTFGSGKEVDSSNSLAVLEWMLPYLYRDFLLLENQIPFFVLEDIYLLSFFQAGISCPKELKYAVLEFFKNGLRKFDIDIFNFVSMNAGETNQDLPLHLLDLVRSSLIPQNRVQGKKDFKKTAFIHCVSKLRLAGIKVSRRVKVDSFLEVNFKDGKIEMPNIALSDLMCCFLSNCVAFEQCHKRCGKHFSVYATFLDFLVNTPKDIEYLLECNVIDNYLADDSKAADFINNAGKDLVFNTEKDFYLDKLFKDVDEHYRTQWKWKFARFSGEYIEKPWLFLSAAGGILLVLGTLIQAIVASLTYKYKK